MECVLPEPARSLSEVGKEARETLRFTRSLPSVKPVFDEVLAFLESLWTATRPQVLLVVGDWGEGKTALYNGLIEPFCRSRGCHTARVLALRVFECFSAARREGYDVSDSLLYAIACALLDKPLPADSAVREALRLLGAEDDENPILVYIDEFEDIVAKFDTEQRLVIEVLQGLEHLINTESRLLRSYGLESRLHLGIAVSRAAYHVLHSRGETSSIWPRMTRRVRVVQLRRLTQLESAYLIDNLLKLVFDGKVGVDGIAERPSLLNPILAASMGLPGALERAVNTLVHALRSRCERGTARLTLRDAVDVLSLIEVNIEGVNEHVLIPEEYSLEEERCAKALSQLGGSTREACRLVLLSGHGVRDGDIEGLAQRAHILMVRRGVARRARIYRLRVEPAKFIEAFGRIVAELREDPVYSELLRELGEDPLSVYRELLDSYAGFCSNGGYCVSLPEEVELGDRLGSREYRELVEEVLRRLEEEGVIEEDGGGLLVPFNMYSRYVFTHEIMLLEFVERRERLRVWREARRLEPKHVLPPLAAILAHRLALRLGGERLVRTREVGESHVRLSIVPAGEASKVDVELPNAKLQLRVPHELKVLVTGYTAGLASLLEKLYGGEHLVLVYSIGSPLEVEEERERAEKSLGVPVVLVPLSRSVGLRLAALGFWASLKGVEPDSLIDMLYRVMLKPSEQPKGLPNAPRVYNTLFRIGQELQLDSIADECVKRLRDRGIMLPDTLRDSSGKTRSPDELVDAAQWLSLYPERLDIWVGIDDIYESVEEDVRRHMKIGARGALLRADIESSKKLAEYIASLEALGLIEYRRDTREVRLRLLDSPYVRRLYSLLSRGPAPVQEVANGFIDASGGYALKALLETLATLGVVEIDKNGTMMLADAEKKIAETRGLLQGFEHDLGKLVDKLGYLVFVKKRGYRVSLTRELIESIEKRLGMASSLGKGLEAARLANAAWKIGEYILGFGKRATVDVHGCNRYSRHAQLIRAAEIGVRLLLQRVEKTAKSVEEALQSLEELVNKHIAESQIRLQCSLLSEARARLEEARAFLDKRLSRTEVEAVVKRLLEEAGVESNPFFYRDSRYCNNYKWWYVAERMGLERLADELQTVRESIAGLAREASRIIEDARRGLESIRSYIVELRERGKLGAVLADLVPVPERLPRLKPKRSAYDLARREEQSSFHREVLSEWERMVEEKGLRERLERLIHLLDKREELVRRAESVRRRIERVAGEARSLADIDDLEVERIAASIVERAEASISLVEKSLADLEELQADSLEEAERLLEKKLENLSGVVSDAEKTASELERLLDAAKDRLSHLIKERIEAYSALESLARSIGSGVEELESIVGALRKARMVLGSRDTQRLVETLRSLRSLPEPRALLERVGEKLGLSREELEVLAQLAERGTTLSKLVERYGVEKAWELLRSLYEKGLIDVKLEPRQPSRPSL